MEHAYFDREFKGPSILHNRDIPYKPKDFSETLDYEKPGQYNKKKKKRGIRTAKRFQPKTAMEKFVKDTLLDQSYRNSVILGTGDFIHFVLEAIRKMNLDASATKRTRNSRFIAKLILPFNNVIFLTLESFIPSINKGNRHSYYFPLLMNTKGLLFFLTD